MSATTTAVVVLQAGLGLVGLAAGGAKVAGQAAQVEEFERYGYPQWLRVGTGAVEVLAGLALLAAFVAPSVLAPVGGVLFGAVLVGAVVTHARLDDPTPKLAVPLALLVVSAAVAISHLWLPL